MQSSSSRANDRTSPQARACESVTNADLAQVESRFDSLIPGSPWCGYGTGDVDGVLRLLLFVNLDEQRAMTVTRHSDGGFEVSAEDGAPWPEVTLDAILGRLSKIGSTTE